MKKNIFAALFVFLMNIPIFGQGALLFCFDQDTNFIKYFYIDSTDYNNQWQVGKPNKTVFNSAYSMPNALVTDTANAYISNNTSTIVLWQLAILPKIGIVYHYKMNSETLVDYAKIEASVDRGSTWIDLSAPISPFHIWFAPPVFSGSTNFWEFASLEFDVEYFSLQPGDTVLFKFSFISNGINTQKDGWMIDNLVISHSHGIGINDNLYKSDVFQIAFKGNRVVELIYLKNEDINNAQFHIYNLLGKKTYSNTFSIKEKNTFYIPDLAHGVYLYFITHNKKLIQAGKFMLMH